MFDELIIYIAKALASYAISCLVKRLGHTAAANHIMTELENAKPLPVNTDPSPASLRRPPQYTDN